MIFEYAEGESLFDHWNFEKYEKEGYNNTPLKKFRKMPTKNDLGKDYYGTKRLKSPEENELNSPIDELTNEFTLGAIIFDMFSNVKNNDERYKKGMFIPNEFNDFELSRATYDVLLKSTNYDRNKKYKNINEFKNNFYRSLSGEHTFRC